MEDRCPFCSPLPAEVVLQNLLCFARYDRYPVARGHLLIIPFRHVASFFDLTDSERNDAIELIWQAKQKLDGDFHPNGYNMGVNVGHAAGQTILHAHIHLIPRYQGDVERPEGGVRGVIPQNRLYRDQP